MTKKTSKNSFSQKIKNIIWHYKLNYLSFVLLVIGIAIGLLVTAQLRAKPVRSTDSVISYSSLNKTKEKLLENQANYKTTIKEINYQIDEAQEIIKNYSNSKEKVEQVEEYENKIGLTDLSGSGVYITLSDSNEQDVSANSIAHAADLRDIVNLLWGNGAQAISINSERIVINTSIDCIVNTVLINSTKTTPPFIIEAIGNKDKIFLALNNHENLKDIYSRVEDDGLIFEFSKRDDINIESFNGSLKLDHIEVNNYE